MKFAIALIAIMYGSWHLARTVDYAIGEHVKYTVEQQFVQNGG